MSLYDQIGEDSIRRALTNFYVKVFDDPMIGFFFFNHDRDHITSQQIDFVSGMLGGPRRYRGKPLPVAHYPLAIRPPHFARRQILLRETLSEVGVPSELIDQWLALEDELRPFIFKGSMTCLNDGMKSK